MEAIQLNNPNNTRVTPSKLNSVAKRCFRPETKLIKNTPPDTKNKPNTPNLKLV
jgi:Asp/Glu/hydantoin racemase